MAQRSTLLKVGINPDAGQPKRKGKARHPKGNLPKEVKCALCGKKVKTKDTRKTPIGRACKKHQGV